MLLNPHDWSLAQQMDRVLPELSEELSARVTQETHRSALELSTGVHADVPAMAEELLGLRRRLDDELAPLGLRCASAATAPVHRVARDRDLQRRPLRAGARLDARAGAPRAHFRAPRARGHARSRGGHELFNRMRAHLPLLLALSVNSPFWQGRDTGLASARTPLFQAFPRVGIPRPFEDYADWVESVDLMIRCDAFPDPTFLWWDVRPQPRFGTVEVRIMDAQITRGRDRRADGAGAVHRAARDRRGLRPPKLVGPPEVLDENRFIAARDGMKGDLIDPDLRVSGFPARGGARVSCSRRCAPARARTGLRGGARAGCMRMAGRTGRRAPAGPGRGGGRGCRAWSSSWPTRSPRNGSPARPRRGRAQH